MFRHTDNWTGRAAHRELNEQWIGKNEFFLKTEVPNAVAASAVVANQALATGSLCGGGSANNLGPLSIS